VRGKISVAGSLSDIAVMAWPSLGWAWRASVRLMRDFRLRIGNCSLARPRFDRSHRPADRRRLAPKQ
jgi:hypothetical protein